MRWLLPAFLLLAFAAACGSDAPPEGGTYIALGDSLSSGSGASDKATTAFVPLVHQSLGPEFELLNLSHSGDASHELLDHGHLNEAVGEIEARKGDGDASNDVRLLTLEIGGDDLLDLLPLVLGGTCPNVEAVLTEPTCIERLGAAPQRLESNLDSAISRLQQADREVTIVLMTVYNPFSGSIPSLAELSDLALEGLADSSFPEGINDVIRAQAEESDVILVDIHPLFEGKAGELIADDLIHPNDEGYRVIAEAVIQALDDAF